MYTGRRPLFGPSNGQINEWAAGFIYLVNQEVLVFGHDRKAPVNERPVVEVRREGNRAVVLPCTTKNKTASTDFFELTPERVMWVRAEQRRSFAYYRYEVILQETLRIKIGVMNHPARLDLAKWLKEHW